MRKAIVSIDILEKRKDGGRITISTGALDRDLDRVIPAGGQVENYLKNPVVQWGHNYRDPWATVGKTNSIEITTDKIEVDFDLRPAVNDADPQNIVLLLWGEEFVKSGSIGFNPNWEKAVENDEGGFDFHSWELLEWSLVPVPANQEALRNAVKALSFDEPLTPSLLAQIKAALKDDEPEAVTTVATSSDEIVHVLADDVEPEPEDEEPPEPTEEDDEPPLTDEEMERLLDAIEAWLSATYQTLGEPS